MMTKEVPTARQHWTNALERRAMAGLKSSSLESIVESLPDDVDRIRVLQVLAAQERPMPLGKLANTVNQSSGYVANVLVEAARDGLLSFSEDKHFVSLTPLGRRVTRRK
jgi:hypothetical protein